MKMRQRWSRLLAGGLVVSAMSLTFVASTASTASASATKSPIAVMGMMDLTGTGGFYIPNEDSWKGAVNAINADGGINGHPINLIICDTAESAAAAATCGSEAVSDHVALVLDLASEGTYMPYLDQAKIADISSGLNSVVTADKNAFSLWAGTAAVSGPVTTAKEVGCKSVIFVGAFGESPTELNGLNALNATIGKDVGIKTDPEVSAPMGTVDFTPFVAQALTYNPGCIVVQGLGTDEVGLIRAVVDSGTKAKLITISVYLPPASASSLGPAVMDKISAIATDTDEATDLSNPAVKLWVSETKQYAPKPTQFESAMAYAWSQVQLAAYALKHAKSFSSSSVLSYLSHLSCYNPGILPTENLSKPADNPAGNRVFGPYLANTSYKNGAFYRTGPFYNVFTGKKAALGPNVGGCAWVPEGK